MESTTNAFAASKTKKRKKHIRNLIILLVAFVLLAAAVMILMNRLRDAAEETSVLTYRAASVSSGEISSTISGTGTIAALDATSVTAAAKVEVKEVFFRPGDTIAAGEVVMTLASDELETQLDELQDDLETAQATLAGTKQFLSSRNVTATKAGVVKSVVAKEGDIVDDMAYLCLISTDESMRVTIDAPNGLQLYDDVRVSIADETQDGVVTELEDGKAVVVFDDDSYSIGEKASVLDADGALLGSGLIDVNEYVAVTATAGRILSVAATENRRVGRGTTLFTLAVGAPTEKYLTNKQAVDELTEQITELNESLTIAAEYDCTLTALSVEAGDEVAAGGSLCTLSGVDGYTLTLSIDELDIASVKLDQSAVITLDALEDEEYAGTVTNISYAGSGSYVTSYTASVTTEPIPNAYPGMSASVEIVTETSGPALIVPVSAVQYEGDKAYLTLADSATSAGTIVTDGELALDALTKAYVTTGMSDGSYIVVEGEGLGTDTIIWIVNRTTSATYVEEDDASTFGFGMGGGAPSGFNGGDNAFDPRGEGRGSGMGGNRPGN